RSEWRMSPSRRFLSISILISLIPSSIGLTCHSCEGVNCKEGECQGDYCVSSYYNPKWGGQSLLSKRTLVKGCFNGTMLANNINSHCIFNTDTQSNEMCICNSEMCTSKKQKMGKVEREKVTCKCSKEAKGCDKGKCTGDLCTWTKSINGKSKPIMGCMDYSLPVLERRAIDSCMLPPMVGSMHFHSVQGTDPNLLLSTESCICSTPMCNTFKPFKLSEKEEKATDTQQCVAYVKGVVKGKEYKTKTNKCYGEFCYQMKVRAQELGQISSYNATGCITFNPKSEMDPLFGTGGKVGEEDCADFTGQNLKLRSCYKTNDEEGMKRLEASIVEGEDDEMENEDEEEVDVKDTAKGKNGKANGKKEEKMEEEEEDGEENGEEKGEKEEEEKE
ncbi:hypothetical protein PENTCL1PPCAC_22958, partial [Pristionchus entomophagus]